LPERNAHEKLIVWAGEALMTAGNGQKTIPQDVLDREWMRAKKLYSASKHGSVSGFSTSAAFADWWIETFRKQNGCCTYCETSFDDLRKLIDASLIKTRKVRGKGSRGRSPELERRDPELRYSPENCSLACYYCNNDKSYTYPEDQYRSYFGPARKRHFEYLKTQLKS
jgi:hypothetical protein